MKKISAILVLSMLMALMMGTIPTQASPSGSSCEHLEQALLKVPLKSRAWYRLLDLLGAHDCDSDGDGRLNKEDDCPFNPDRHLEPFAYLPGYSLQDEYLYVCNLSWAYLSYADLTGANLTAANLERAVVNETNLTGANLTATNLSHMFGEANLTGANLTAANLEAAILPYSDLSYADLSYANLSYALLTGANLRGANLYGANLDGANLDYVLWDNTTCPDGTNSSVWDPQTCGYNLTLP